MRYEWTDGADSYILEEDGEVYVVPEVGARLQCGEVPRFVAREILRLAARVNALEEGVEAELRGQAEISEAAGRMRDKLSTRIAELEAAMRWSR